MNKIMLLGLNGRAGPLHYASNISSSLAEIADTYLFLPSYSDSSQVSKKVNLIRINAPPSILKTFFLTFNIFQHLKAVREINKTNSQVLNILDIHPWYVMYWPFLRAQKKIVTINDPEPHSGEAGLFVTFLIKRITRFLLKRADKIVVLGKKQEEVIRRLGYKQEVIVSRIGHYDFFTAKTNKKLGTETKTLLFFGRIKEYKGIDYLLDALIALKNKQMRFKLIIAGEGDLSPYTAKISSLGADYVETYTGYIPDDKVAECFQRASFVVMPYTDATQTGVAQIACSFKKPVIATNVGSLPEVVLDKKTGIIVEPKNSEQLAAAIKKLLEYPETAKELGNAGYKFIQEEYDWKKIARKLYESIFLQ